MDGVCNTQSAAAPAEGARVTNARIALDAVPLPQAGRHGEGAHGLDGGRLYIHGPPRGYAQDGPAGGKLRQGRISPAGSSVALCLRS
jgi:hypothetical protein